MPAKTTYALLIYRAAQEPTAANERRALQGHRKLQAVSADRGELYAVAQLDDVSTAKTIRLQRGVHAVADGPYIETKEELAGYLVVDCASPERAAEIAAAIPDARFAAVEVRPIMDLSGQET